MPVILFGIVGFFNLTPIFLGSIEKWREVVFSIFPIFALVIIYIILKISVLDLIDEVYDEGPTLLFKNGGKQVRINLTDIKNVTYTSTVNPQRVTVSLRYETELGKELTFSPPASPIPFMKNKDIVDLIDRIARARA